MRNLYFFDQFSRKAIFRFFWCWSLKTLKLPFFAWYLYCCVIIFEIKNPSAISRDPAEINTIAHTPIIYQCLFHKLGKASSFGPAIVSKWQFKIFSEFFSILYDILSKHDQYPKHLGHLHKYWLCMLVSLVKKNIHSFIHLLISNFSILLDFWSYSIYCKILVSNLLNFPIV